MSDLHSECPRPDVARAAGCTREKGKGQAPRAQSWPFPLLFPLAASPFCHYPFGAQWPNLQQGTWAGKSPPRKPARPRPEAQFWKDGAGLSGAGGLAPSPIVPSLLTGQGHSSLAFSAPPLSSPGAGNQRQLLPALYCSGDWRCRRSSSMRWIRMPSRPVAVKK
jgi:hypothetical protein